MEIHVSPGIKKRFFTALAREYPSMGWVFGWHTHVGIVGVGCVASSGSSVHDLINDLEQSMEFLPAGLDIVGVFTCGLHRYNEHEVNDFFENLKFSGFQILSETNEFCFLTQSHQDRSCLGYLYNSAEGLSLPVNIKQLELQTLLSMFLNFRVRSLLSLTFEKHLQKGDEENLNENFEELKKKLCSSIAAYHLSNSEILIQTIPQFKSSISTVVEDTTCEELWDYVSNEFEERSIAQEKRKTGTKLKILTWNLLFQTSGETAVNRTISCLPIIHHEHRSFESVTINIPVDMMVMIPRSFVIGKIPQIFSIGICRQLNAIKHCILENEKSKDLINSVEIFHFQPSECNHFISVPYPTGILESELELVRRKLHHRLLFSEDRPVFRRTNQFYLPQLNDDVYLINPHEELPVQGLQENNSLVTGSYTYYHYMQNNFDDKGWGCAYRSFQTIFSWFRHQGYTNCSIPSHREIQQALVDVGDKPSSFINSKTWIGSLEVSYCLQHLIGISSKIMNVSSGTELTNKARELQHHFKVQGIPIMIGGGMYAYTILGINFDDKTGNVKFLVLDPHYVGPEDINIILNKGWCAWKNSSFWDATCYYNLCLPQRPLDI